MNILHFNSNNVGVTLMCNVKFLKTAYKKIFTFSFLIVLSLTAGSFIPFWVCAADVVEYNYEDPNPMMSADGRYTAHRNSVDNAPNPTFSKIRSREGAQSFRAYINRLDPINNYRMEITGFTPDRNEVNNGEETEDYWYGWSTYIPGPYPPFTLITNFMWETFFQLHARPPQGETWATYIGQSPPLAIQLEPTSDNAGKIVVKIRGMDDPYPQQRVSGNSHVKFNRSVYEYKTDEWIDFVVHTRLSSDSHGFTKIWVNGELVVDYKGMNYYLGHGEGYPLHGLYMGWANTPKDNPEPVIEREIFHDSLRLSRGSWGGSYEAVAPKTSSLSAPTGVRLQF
ncbi:hypothetical protein CKO25_20190 [Thiocapsa imhoffii]|uniref:Polysaccharide lyase n=1 Tax=Thiocapsa imhoffii TaxID=382777 RepID=A0A9X0WM49_9GAMM|nr:heparin lyase I family protein [Thiocapsa imhoffii]MBK1646900.1 hypothetical protein [Thiocapsa imhoffii]